MASPISTRTPEGLPNRCPLCQADVTPDPSRPPGDAPCPACGKLLWFNRGAQGAVYYDAEAVAGVRQKVKEMVASHLSAEQERVTDSASFLGDLGADSLDVVELTMALDEEFDVNIPDDQAAKILTVADAVEYIYTHPKEGGERKSH
jgi:acyl carrier protein